MAGRAVLALEADDLGGDDVERLVPADGLVAGLAALVVLRSPSGSQSTRLSGVRMRLGA